MALTYSTYVSQLANLMVVQASSDTNFQTFLPGCIDYAEQRMYRELDLLATRVSDSTGRCTPNNRGFILPTTAGTFLVVEQVNVFTPVGTVLNNHPLSNVSMSWVDQVYPSNSIAADVPQFWAMRDNMQIFFGPSPNSSYTVQVRGTIRPTPLSSINTSTILTTMLPDAFMAASMIFATGYQRDFGSQSDDPARAASWEAQYQKLIESAGTEELRKKYQSQAWTNQIPNPIATPPRA